MALFRMGTVRTPMRGAFAGVKSGSVPAMGRWRHPSGTRSAVGVPVLDVIYLALTLALFALAGLVAKGVEKL